MVLVTGGTGLVGSHLLFSLVKKGEKVRALKRNSSDIKNVGKVFSYYSIDHQQLASQIEWVDGDILDVCSLTEAMENVAVVYHCAAIISFDPKDNELMMKTNVTGTANIVNAALEKKVKKLCYVSSVAALGEVRTEINETVFWKSSPKNSNYSISKYAAEREVWRGIEEGLNAVIVNPSVIIGGGDWDKSSSRMIRRAYKKISFYAEGVTGFVDVHDLTAIMIQLTEGNINKERFIVSSENLSYKDFFSVANACFGNKPPTIKVGKLLYEMAWRTANIKSYVTGKQTSITKEIARTACQKNYYSNKKIKDTLGFEFIPVKKSIEDTCRLFRETIKPV